MQRLYMLYDLAAKSTYASIIADRADESAIRSFSTLLERKDTLPGMHPKDFQLLYIGNIDDNTGELEPAKPTAVYTGAEWLLEQQLRKSEPSTERIGPNALAQLELK